MRGMRRVGLLLVLSCVLAACGGQSGQPETPAKASARTPVREPLVGGPYPAILVAQAQFTEGTGADGKPATIPGAAKLLIVRRTESGWKSVVLEDPDSNVFHKALPWDGGLLTIGGNQALLRTWRFADGAWTSETRWNPKFGGKFDRLRDIERGDVDGDGKDELVIATHDQGVIAVVHPDDGWRVEEVDHTPDTFVHEIEIGDVDGDGIQEFFATPSAPNKLESEQPGEVRMYKHTPQGWQERSSTHRATRTRRRSSPPTSTATGSRSCTCRGKVRWDRGTRWCGPSPSSSTGGRTAPSRAPSSPPCPIA